MHRCGGDQRCPWCREWMNRHDSTSTRDFRGGFLTEICCGNCAGTSIWKWEMGFVYVTAGDRPPAADRPSAFGDGEFIRRVIGEAREVIANRQAVRLRPAESGAGSPSEASASAPSTDESKPNPTDGKGA